MGNRLKFHSSSDLKLRLAEKKIRKPTNSTFECNLSTYHSSLFKIYDENRQQKYQLFRAKKKDEEKSLIRISSLYRLKSLLQLQVQIERTEVIYTRLHIDTQIHDS